jgi:DNA-binding GntR family transcriptional regulator
LKNPELNLNQDSDYIYVEGVNLPGDEIMMLELFSVSGQLIAQQEVKVLNGELSTSFSKANLNSGIYLARIGKESFQRVKKISVTK